MGRLLTVIIPSITINMGGMCTSERHLIEALSKFYDVIRISSNDNSFGIPRVSTVHVDRDTFEETAKVLENLSADLVLWPAIYGYPKMCNRPKVLWVVAAHNRMPDFPGIVTLDEVIKEIGNEDFLREVGA